MKNLLITFFFTILALNVTSLFGSPQIKERLEQHINYLASDSLRGREAGTESEKQAAGYIRNEFIKVGLSPAGNNDTFYQDFEFIDTKTIGNNNALTIDGESLKIDKDYIPLGFSANGSIKGNTLSQLADSINIDCNTSSRKIFLINVIESEKLSPGSYWNFYELRNFAHDASDKGAEAVIFYNFCSEHLDCKTNLLNKIASVDIPVVLILKKNIIKPGSIQTVSLNVELIKHYRTARNVLGWIDNGAENTVIIGAHFDHLGVSANDTIYNGADDNASGTAMLIEIARWMSKSNYHKKNYLFIAFSGEEKGLLGSIYFTNNSTVDLNKVMCMICFDQVGRMDELEKTITIIGVGTSPKWHSFVEEFTKDDIIIETYLSGVGPTDYTSFYLKNIPVFDFFTGFNEDYHEPTDDIFKINYDGMLIIFDFVTTIMSTLDNVDKMEFTKTNIAEELLKYLFRFIDYSFDEKYKWK